MKSEKHLKYLHCIKEVEYLIVWCLERSQGGTRTFTKITDVAVKMLARQEVAVIEYELASWKDIAMEKSA